MIDYDPQQPLIFIHIPKTAGTSVRAIFQAWYGDGLYEHYFDPKCGAQPYRHNLFENAKLSEPSVIFGHFNSARRFGVQDYYPEATQFVTIIRDPFEQMLSRYFFIRKRRHFFEKYREIPEDDLLKHILTYRSNIMCFFPCEVTLDNYKEVIESQFVEIGVTEHLNESMKRIALKIGFTFIPEMLAHENETARDKTIDQNLIGSFRDRHKLEYLVYDFIRCRY